MKNPKINSNARTFLIKSLILGFAFILPLSASADSLIIEFESDPLFSESNFLPGSSVLRWARLSNGTDFSQDILVEAINITDRDKFGDVLNMTITENGSELFNGTLSKFFNTGEIFLSELGAGEETEYDFNVSFKNESANDYQESTLGFDILIGFRGEGSPLPPGGEGGGGGGAGGGENGGGSGGSGYVIPPRGLVILDESTVVTSISTTTASISWATSHKSTSRVIYDTISGVFDFNNLPNYGYGFSTIEFDTPPEVNGVTYHTVFITGLTSGTTYYYRVVSHASPPSVGVEKKFTTLGLKDDSGKDYGEQDEVLDGVGGEGVLEPELQGEKVNNVFRGRGLTAEAAKSASDYKKEGGSTSELQLNEDESIDGRKETELGALEKKTIENSEEDLFLNSTASLVRGLFSKRWFSAGFLIIALVGGVLAIRKVLRKSRTSD